jgi:hypothetical protein
MSNCPNIYLATVNLPRLYNPGPNLLDKVPGGELWPLFSIQRCLASRDVSRSRIAPAWPLNDLPGKIQGEINWYADVGSEEV